VAPSHVSCDCCEQGQQCKSSNASDSTKAHVEIGKVPLRLYNMPKTVQNENVRFRQGAGKLISAFRGPTTPILGGQVSPKGSQPPLWDILGTWIRVNKSLLLQSPAQYIIFLPAQGWGRLQAFMTSDRSHIHAEAHARSAGQQRNAGVPAEDPGLGVTVDSR